MKNYLKDKTLNNSMKKRGVLIVLMLFLFVNIVSAEYDTHKFNTTLLYTITSNNATACNATALTSQDGLFYINSPLTKNGQTFNGSINASYFQSEIVYCLNIICTDGVSYEGGNICRTVTGNGQSKPGDFTILGFSVVLIIIFFSLITYVLKSMGNIVEGNFDLLDVAFWWGLYFALLGVTLLAKTYLGTLVVINWLQDLVFWLGFPMILVPILAFILSLIRTGAKNKKEKAKW